MSEHLDAFERARLARAEQAIRTGIDTIARAGADLGRALWEIRDDRLYREVYPRFEAYCRDRWSLSARHANRLIHYAQVNAALGPIGPAETESQARELAPLLDEPGLMRRAWATVVRRTGGRPTARAIREAVHETTPAPAAPDATAPGTAGAGAPADPLRGASAGDTRSTETTEPPASQRAGEGGGAAEARPMPGRSASGAPDDAPGGRVSGAPAGPRPEPQPVSPPSAGLESGGTAAPPSSSQEDGADGAPPSPHPVGDGGDAGPLLTEREIHEALTDEWSPVYLEESGCRFAMVRANAGEPIDRAVAWAIRRTARPGRLTERAKAVRS